MIKYRLYISECICVKYIVYLTKRVLLNGSRERVRNASTSYDPDSAASYCRANKEDFDVELFKQMIEHRAFDGNSMLGLVNTTFGWIKQLHCPFRDKEADAAKLESWSARLWTK